MSESISLTVTAVTILSGQSLSPALALGARQLHGIAMPAAWDAAALSFQVSLDGVIWLEMQSAAAAISVLVAASQYVALDPLLWRAVNQVKLRSGTSGAPVVQTADRIVSLVTRPIA